MSRARNSPPPTGVPDASSAPGTPSAASVPGTPSATGASARDATLYLQRLATERGYSPRTIESYRHDLAVLGSVAGERGWGAIAQADLRRWIAQAVRQSLAPRTIARRLSAWRGFFDWLAERGSIAANPARGLRAPRVGKRLPKALSPDQALELMKGPRDEGQAFELVRDQAMLELLYSSGLRLSELTSLDLRHFGDGAERSRSWLDLAEAEVTVLGKGGKRRSVPVGAPALDALARWLAERERWLAAHPGADPRALFLSARGGRLANRTVQVRLKRLAQRRGVPADVHPHVLRHSFASHLLQSSGDLRAVQELLGHANITTTQVYTSLDFQRLAKVYDAAHPRARRR
jgi:integrase/recombinase XerC